MRALLVCFVGSLLVALAMQQKINDKEWIEFLQKYGKSYDNETVEAARYEVFRRRNKEISIHNAQANKTYTLEHQFFSDFTQDEINKLTGLVLPSDMRGYIPFTPSIPTANIRALPAAVDWRQKGAVTPVKYQGSCGACWSFSAVGALEAQYFIKYGSLMGLSEQEFVDCAKSQSTRGCNGGWMVDAFSYARNGFIAETSYPYISGRTATPYNCRFDASKVVGRTQMQGSSKLIGNDEYAMLNAVATVGPISVTVCANSKFIAYQSGVFTDLPCDNSNSNHRVNHAVLVVGYNTSPTYGDYWIVKNSWSTTWGEGGYIRIARNRGLINNAIYPIIV